MLGLVECGIGIVLRISECDINEGVSDWRFRFHR
jgi:hypothetical protein